MKKGLLALLLLLCSFFSVNATNYWWVGGTASAVEFRDRSNWSTVGVGGAAVGTSGTVITFTTADILTVDGSDVSATAGLQTGAITVIGTGASVVMGQLILTNSATFQIQGLGSTRSYTVGNSTSLSGTDLDIQAGSTLVIGYSSGTSLQTLALLASNTANIAGTLDIGNKVGNNAVFTIGTAGNATVANGGTYKHGISGTTVPTFVWSTGSTCEITGVLSSALSASIAQTYYNFIWNCTGQSASVGMGGNIPTAILGDFTMNSTNGQQLRLGSTSSVKLNVSGNFIMNGSSILALNSSNGSDTLNVTGNVILNSGTLTHNAANNTGTPAVIIGGNLTIAGGTLDMQLSGNNASANNGVVNLAGNFSMSSGFLTKTGTATGANFNFTKSGTQTFRRTASGTGNFSGNMNFTINSGSTVDFDTTTLSGGAYSLGGNFTVASGGGLTTAHASGITSSGTTGTIQVSGTRTFNTGGNYTFNGTASQATGSGFTGANNLIINNSAGVSLSAAAAVTGTLTFTSGKLDLGANNLTLTSATVSGGGSSNYFVTSGAGKILRSIANGGGSFVFPIGRSSSTYNPVTITNTGGAISIYTVGVANTTYPISADRANAQWSIASGTSTTSTFAFTWTTADAGATLSGAPSTGIVYEYNGSSWATTGGTTTGTPNVTTQSGITSGNTLWTVAAPAAVPDIALADNSGGQVATGTITKNTTNNIIYNFQLGVTTANTTLSSVAFATTNNATDVTNYKLYYASSNSFGSASQIGSSITTSTGTGTHTFSSLSQTVNSGSTGYFWIVSDVPTGATPGNTIVVTAITTSDITFTSGNKTGSTSTGGTQTIIAAPTVTTNAAGTITTTSVILNGTVNANASSTTASFDYGTAAPAYGTNVTADQSPITGTGNNSITKTVTGLGTNTLYHFRAKGVNAVSTVNGSDATFTTLSNAPTVGSGNAETSVGFTANWTAPTNDGSETYTYTVEVDNDNAFGSVDATYSSIASGTLSQVVTGLASGTTYYYRVKAVNTTGSSAWSSVSAGVTTTSSVAPTVTTTSISSVTLTTASSGGNVTSDGGDAVTARGVVYNTGGSPTLADNFTTDGSGTGTYGSSLTGLSNNTTYYVRAYATNGVGTSYGGEVNFTTLVAEPTQEATSVSFGTRTNTSLVVNFSGGNGGRRIVVVRPTSAVSFVPTDGVSPSGVDANFSNATNQGSNNKIVYDGTGSTVTVTGLTANTTYHIAVFEYNNNSGGIPNYYATAATNSQATYNPTITTVGTLSAFGNVVSGANSTSQTYTVEGVELASSITVTPPVGFQIATLADFSDAVTNPSTLTLTKDGSDAVATTTIYVRFSPASDNGANSGNVTNSATDATTRNVAASGNAISAEPTTNGTITFGTVTSSSIVLNLPSVGDGGKRIIVAKASGAVDATPADGTSYTANAAFGSGTQLGTGNYVVLNGTASGSSVVTVTGLASGTTYHFAVFEYNMNTGTSQNYLLTGAATNNQATNSASNATDAFRTAATGNWNSTSTWESFTNGGWMAATLTPDASASAITVLNGHTVTVTASVSVDEVTVNSGGQITINSGQTLTIADGTGTDLTVNGTLVNSGTLTMTGTGTVTGSGSTYQHNIDNAAIPALTWGTNSTLYITGITTVSGAVNISGITSVYNLTYNCTSQAAHSTYANYVVLGNSAGVAIAGNFTVQSTGSGVLLIAAGGTTNVTVGGNYSQTGGLAVISRNGGGARSMTVTGNVTISGGTLDIDVVGGSNAYTLNVGGNLDVQSGGTLTGSFGTRTIVFNGTGAQQFSVAGTFSGTVGLELNNTNGLTINNTISVGGTTVRLTAGTITHSGNLTILTGATITRVAGNFATAPTFGGTVSVTYANTGTITSSNELPSSNVTALSTAGGSSTVTIGSSTSIATLTVSGSNLTINSGVTVTASSTCSTYASKTLQIDGTYSAGAALTNSGTMNVGSTGTYKHNYNAGTIPTATWASGSTCEISGNTGSSMGGGLGQSFHHFTWNCPAQATTVNFTGALTTVNGDLTISNTFTSGGLRLTNAAMTLNIGGNLVVSAANGITAKLDLNGSAGVTTVNVGGNVSMNTVGTGVAQLFRSSGSTAVVNFNKASGTQNLTSNYASAFTFNTNAITFNVGTGSTTNTVQMASNIALNSNSTMVVLSGSALSCSTFVLSGATSLTVNSGGTLKVGSLSGSGAVAANVTVTTLTLSTGSTLEYNGAGAQFATARTVTNLTVNNGSTLTLSGNVVVNSTLTLTSGVVTTGGNSITVGVSGTAGTISGASASSYVNGTLKLFVNNAATPTASFPIGDASNYTPVTVAFNGTTTGSGSLTATTTAGAHASIATSGINASKLANRYWTLTNIGITGFTSYAPTFTFVSGDVIGGAATGSFVVRKYNGSTWSTTTTGTLTSTSSQATAVTSFSDFVCGEANTLTVAVDPSNATVCNASGTSFTSSSSSTPSPTIQWQENNGGGFANISNAGIYSGATTGTLSISSVTNGMSGYTYRAVFTNINGSVNSNAATLTVNATSVGGTVASAQSICTGSTPANLTLSGNTGNVTNWQYASDAGFTSPTSISNTTVTLNGTTDIGALTSSTYFRAVVTNGVCAAANSASVLITVNPNGTWTGAVDNNTATAGNWCGGVPASNANIVIAATVNNPTLTANLTVNNITLNDTLVLGGYKLTVNGAVSGTNTVLSGSNASAIEYAGSGSTTLTFDQTTDGNVTNPTSGTNSLKDIITTGTGSLTLANKVNLFERLSVGAGTTFNTGDSLVLRSISGTNGNNTAYVDQVGGTITGQVRVERYIHAQSRGWRAFTSPVTYTGLQAGTVANNWQNSWGLSANYGTRITGPSATNGLDDVSVSASLMKYNSTSGAWTNITNTTTETIAGTSGSADNKSFFMFVRGDRTVTPNGYNPLNFQSTTIPARGKLQTGTQVFNFTGAANKAWLVGNPYACPVDMSTVTFSSNIPDQVYVWDPNRPSSYSDVTGAYVTFDRTTWGAPTAGSTTQYFQTGQCFFVVPTSASGVSITFNESNKSGGNQNNQTSGTSNGLSDIFNVKLNYVRADGSKAEIDGIRAKFGANYSAAVTAEDAYKWATAGIENMSLKRGSSLLSIEARPYITTTDTLFFNATNLSIGANYEFKLNPINFDASVSSCKLVDKFLNTETPISLTSTTLVGFNVTSVTGSNAAGRFYVVFNATGSLPTSNSLTVKAYKQNNNNIKIDWEAIAENNVKTYTVEKSTDANSFTKLSEATAKNGNTTNAYSIVDNNPVIGVNYYRIQSTQTNNNKAYSTIVRVEMSDKGIKSITVYPNPVKSSTNTIGLQMNNLTVGSYTAVLYNAAGQQVWMNTMNHNGSNGSTSLQLNKTLASGTYQLQLTDTKGNSYKQTVLVVE